MVNGISSTRPESPNQNVTNQDPTSPSSSLRSHILHPVKHHKIEKQRNDDSDVEPELSKINKKREAHARKPLGNGVGLPGSDDEYGQEANSSRDSESDGSELSESDQDQGPGSGFAASLKHALDPKSRSRMTHGSKKHAHSHPGLERDPDSQHFSHGMPKSAWSKSKKREMKEKEDGTWDRKRKEDNEIDEKAAKIAADAVRKGRGDLSSSKSSSPSGEKGGKTNMDAGNLLNSWKDDGVKHGPGGDGGGSIVAEGPGNWERDDGHHDFAKKEDHRDNQPDSAKENMANGDDHDGENIDIGEAQKINEQDDEKNLTKAQRDQRKILQDDESRRTRLPVDQHQHDGTPNEVEHEQTKERDPPKGEHGQVPKAMPAIKQQDPPGPRQEVTLKPRIPEMHYHTAKSNDQKPLRDRKPLRIAPDGETENLPNGKIFRHGPDQTDELTRTRDAEKETLSMPDGGDTYDSEAMLKAQHTGPEPTGGFVPGKLQLRGDDDGTGGENESSDDDRVQASNEKNKKKVVHIIPRANHDVEDDEQAMATAQGAPVTPRRPKAQRKWSAFRKEDMSASSRHSYADRMSQQQVPTIKEGTFSSALQMDESQQHQQQVQRDEQHHHHHHAHNKDTVGQKKWAVLRQKLLQRNPVGPKEYTPRQIPLTTELLAGQLPVLIMKTWLDRDEHGHRAVPILLGDLKFRVGDSAGIGSHAEPAASGREVFRIECQYGDGAVKWVIYRELRDFISLHGHYKAENLGNRVSHFSGTRKVEIPEFPKSSLPYLGRMRVGRKEAKWLELSEGEEPGKEEEKQRGKMSKQDQSRQSRMALQQYLVDLIRAVMFRPESNRLCRFLELSALTITLAPRGGFQGKAGFLKISGMNASKRANQPGILPGSGSWTKYKAPKWWIVRESYLVATSGPESTDLFEVFLIDGDFAIERPKRVLRQGLSKLTGHGSFKSAAGLKSHDAGGSGTAQQDRQKAIAAAAGSGHALEHGDEDTGEHHQAAIAEGDEGQTASHHTFFIANSQTKLKLVAKNVRQMQQFIISLERIAGQCIWRSRNRFDSFAPIRMNVAAQWLVDGRDYFWNLSRAINMAKDRIYIHDWWISPELYLRRPGNERYRLDNLLKRKAQEGVKIFLIIYNEVSDRTTPVDSLYVKKRFNALHPNIMVQRSPSHFQTGTFYWSHHEKMCVIDETIMFMGGLDLCFGRWDTAQHVLVDDDFEKGATGENGPIWPGKDLCNDRVTDPFALNKPFEDMFDREKVPRMPWHDVGLQIVGQPARDLCRHFVQRWNHLIRTKNHTRPMPFLLPPADYSEHELKHLRLQGTCEVQICRSCGPWSMGTDTKIEHSIQNAYIKAIQLSEHFVYIENQFFITSTVVDGVEVENRIGDALVDRIIRAFKEKTPWRACIVIPLLPGYAFPIDTAEASSVRLIMECQNRTICRGTQSIFSRLRKEGIDPDDYITFFSLRGWGKFKSGALTTEQVYIHGKTMVVDDRLVICGSANINERSQRGDRDSELAAVIRDTDMIDSKMAGKPFKVGRFAHTLRIRLMREHVGVDVDAIEEDQLMARDPVADADDIQKWDPDHEQKESDDENLGVTTVKRRHPRDQLMATFSSGVSAVTKGLSENAISNVKRAANVVVKPAAIVKEHNTILGSGKTDDYSERQDSAGGKRVSGFASSVVPTLEEKTIYERRPTATHANGRPLFDAIDEGEAEGKEEVHEASVPKEDLERFTDKPVNEQQDGGTSKAPKMGHSSLQTDKYGAPANATENDDAVPNKDTNRDEETENEQNAIKARQTLRKHLDAKVGVSPWTMPTPTPDIDPDEFADPLCEKFWKDMWVAVAVHNTEIYRKVFRCIPDDLVTSWAAYKSFVNHAEKFNRVPTDVAADSSHEPVKTVHGGPGTHGAGGGGSGGGMVQPQGTNGAPEEGKNISDIHQSDIVDGKPRDATRPIKHLSGDGDTEPSSPSTQTGDGEGKSGERKGDAESHGKPTPNMSESDRTPTGPEEAWAEWEKNEMEELLQEVRGHLVMYSTRFLEAEDLAGNFLFNSDKILPMPIYD